MSHHCNLHLFYFLQAVADVGSGDIDLENVVPEPNQVAYASEELEPQADTSDRAQAGSKASSCSEDEEQCFSRSIKGMTTACYLAL